MEEQFAEHLGEGMLLRLLREFQYSRYSQMSLLIFWLHEKRVVDCTQAVLWGKEISMLPSTAPIPSLSECTACRKQVSILFCML